jgi:rhodanese-related sulfurtransferase
MLSPEFDAKIGQIKEKYKGVKYFKLVSLLWVCQSILVARNVCLKKIAEDNAHVSSTDSSCEQRYGKLRRFFQTGLTAELLEGIFMVIISLLPDVEQADLVIDRTNWQLGSRKYNFLTLGMLYQGCFIPLVWQELGYKGNSKWEQQIDLIDKLIGYWRLSNRPLPKFCIKADREFIKGNWIVALQKREINYVIRIKENLRYPMWKNGSMSYKQVNLATYRRYMKRYKVDKLELVVAGEVIANLVVIPNGTKQANVKDKDRFVYLLTNLDDLDLAAQQYRLRWKIECWFAGHCGRVYSFPPFYNPASQPLSMGRLNEILSLAQARAREMKLAFEGALTPREAYEVLQLARHARLIDVRTKAELDWVGRVPGAIEIEWQDWPAKNLNPYFMQTLKHSVVSESLLLFLCRSGQRSAHAAKAATEAGYPDCYNILEGFEGNKDANGQRNRTGGWRHAGLPWNQS